MIRQISTFTFLSLLPPVSVIAGGSNVPNRICLAPASIEASAGSSATLISAVRETFTTFLTGPSLEVKALTARLQSQVREEAKLAKCPYLLLTTVKHVQKTGRGGALRQMAAAAAAHGAASAGAASGSAAGRIVGNAAAGAATEAAYGYATSVRSQDELTLTYRLESVGGNVIVNKKEKRKARSDAEDLLTPVVEKASEAIAAALTNRNP
jgi:hypothetical protein